jgi:hypothetical protein
MGYIRDGVSSRLVQRSSCIDDLSLIQTATLLKGQSESCDGIARSFSTSSIECALTSYGMVYLTAYQFLC